MLVLLHCDIICSWPDTFSKGEIFSKKVSSKRDVGHRLQVSDIFSASHVPLLLKCIIICFVAEMWWRCHELSRKEGDQIFCSYAKCWVLRRMTAKRRSSVWDVLPLLYFKYRYQQQKKRPIRTSYPSFIFFSQHLVHEFATPYMQ